MKEGRKGRDTVQMNSAVQVGLTQTRIGNSAMRLTLMSSNIPAPSDRGMQKSANKVCDQIEELNKTDMGGVRKRIREINTHRGNPPSKVDLMVDATYNNPIYSGGGKTPLQPASQVMFSTIEHNTKDQYVLDLVIKNKLCNIWPPCDSEHSSHCKGNLPLASSICNEQAYCSESLENLKRDGLEVDKLVTDTGAIKAADKIYKCCTSCTKPQHYLDPIHLNLTTKKVESVNRRLKRSLPSSVNFTRNFSGRAHRAVYSVNHRPGNAIKELYSGVGCPITAGSSVSKDLDNEQKRHLYNKALSKSIKGKIQKETEKITT
ncbi:uncharacterized protein LOC117315189 [Pecten maximus]|uniref:uncharacterized protein LOC117315189 n=1 Tax=Pecten maximus TaxID=6579 RepID=UPI0014582339|nr:uncharacterized protein LOC117315189 [Pecten maximus]